MINFIHELNTNKKIFNEGCLYEGTHYDKEAAKILAEVCDIETAEKIIDSLIKEDWVSIFTHTNWIYKFLKPVARIFVEETKRGKSLDKVIQDTFDILGRFLIFVKDNQNDKDKLFSFFDKAHYQDVQKFIDDYQKELEKQEATLDKPKYNSSDYDVIKIDSYKQLHEMFGGKWTGDGQSEKAADNTEGHGNTAWCHANSKLMWDTHTKNGRLLFFVAAKKGWKDIPPEQTEGNPKDAYGLSLIAIVTTKRGKLLETTLRWNHVNVSNADHVFQTWGELNRACGQDIQKECEKYFVPEDDISLFVVKEGVLQRNPAVEDDGYYKADLEEVLIPEGTKIIGEGVFSTCLNLRKVVIPNGVTKIDDRAFYRCDSLTDIIIPNSVTEIGENAFVHCVSLTHIALPNGITSIGDSAFYTCKSLTSITIPDGVTEIGDQAFCDCNNLKSIKIPDSVESIGTGVFNNCTSLTNITIPNNVTNISDYAFAECSSLTDIKIPDNVTNIGMYAFSSCDALKSIIIPDSVESIGNRAFMHCDNLTHIALPNHITIIGNYVFYGCSKLKTIDCNNSKIIKLIKSQIEQYKNIK